VQYSRISRHSKVLPLAYNPAGEWYTIFKDCETLLSTFPESAMVKAPSAKVEQLKVAVTHVIDSSSPGAYMSIRNAEHPP
jgi:hypothetical protein